MDRQVLQSIGKKAGFGDLMTEPKFLELLGRYSNLLQVWMAKRDSSTPRDKVVVVMKYTAPDGLVVMKRDIDSELFKIMPPEMMQRVMFDIAMQYREKVYDPV
jgi:hypothetical protein